MSNKSLSTEKIILVILFLICPAPSHADAEEPHLRSVPLSWERNPNALRYEIEIGKKDDGRYMELHREFTEATSIELSLPPGSYRHRMRPYDLLNHPGEWNEWKTFEVPDWIKRPPPPGPPIQIKSSRVYRFLWTRDENAFRYEVVIEIEENGEWSELPRKSTEATSIELPMLPGSYRYSVIYFNLWNQPEVCTQSTVFEVPDISEPPLYSGIAWVSLIPINGKGYFKQNFYPIGARLRGGVLLKPDNFLHFALEVAVSWFYLGNPFDDNKNTAQMIILDPINLFLRIPFSNQTALSFRIFGFGVTILASRDVTSQINFGISFFLPILKRSYIEAGLDFSHFFGWYPGALRPWIGFGIRF
jgi:hypothetical protein